MTGAEADPQVMALFLEVATIDHLIRGRVRQALPRGMELSHLLVLDHLIQAGDERTPAHLARIFHLSKAAMSNTLTRLEAAGFVHVRPDWEDARRKLVTTSPAGVKARDAAFAALAPVLRDAAGDLGPEDLRAVLPILRKLRSGLVSR